MARLSRENRVRVGLVLVVGLAGVWFFRHWAQVSTVWSDLEAARMWLRSQGVYGGVVFIALNALQIVVAPLPGYPMYAAAGYVFGVWVGGFYATVGLALGALMASSLGRAFGRPLVVRMVGEATLRRWEHMVHADSPWLWFLAFLGPTGDVPFHIAGLSSVPLWQIVALAVLVRGPAVFIAAGVGAGVVSLAPHEVAFILLAAGALMVGLHHLGKRVQRQLHSRNGEDVVA